MTPAIRRIGFLCSIAALAAPGDAADKRSGTDLGVYSAEQADAGRRVYMLKCAMCHGNDLMGTVETPGLTGRFMANWGNKPLSELAAYVARAMPQQDPGSLSPDETSEIVAFVLQANGFPAGAKALPVDSAALQRITIRARDY